MQLSVFRSYLLYSENMCSIHFHLRILHLFALPPSPQKFAILFLHDKLVSSASSVIHADHLVQFPSLSLLFPFTNESANSLSFGLLLLVIANPKIAYISANDFVSSIHYQCY